MEERTEVTGDIIVGVGRRRKGEGRGGKEGVGEGRGRVCECTGVVEG